MADDATFSDSSLNPAVIPGSTPAVSDIPTPAIPSFNHAHHYISLKLTTTNYLLWKTQVLPFLHGLSLFDYIDGSIPCPPSPASSSSAPNHAVLAWQRHDATLMSFLIASLHETVIPLIVGKTTSRAIWNTLAEAFASPSQTRITSIHMALQEIHHETNETISSFLQRVKGHVDDLAAAGHPVSDSQLNVYIYRGLQPEFRRLLPPLMNQQEPMTFSALHGALLSHELLTKMSISDALSLPIVAVA